LYFAVSKPFIDKWLGKYGAIKKGRDFLINRGLRIDEENSGWPPPFALRAMEDRQRIDEK
jgi:hypothetical protein